MLVDLETAYSVVTDLLLTAANSDMFSKRDIALLIYPLENRLRYARHCASARHVTETLASWSFGFVV